MDGWHGYLPSSGPSPNLPVSSTDLRPMFKTSAKWKWTRIWKRVRKSKNGSPNGIPVEGGWWLCHFIHLCSTMVFLICFQLCTSFIHSFISKIWYSTPQGTYSDAPSPTMFIYKLDFSSLKNMPQLHVLSLHKWHYTNFWLQLHEGFNVKMRINVKIQIKKLMFSVYDFEHACETLFLFLEQWRWDNKIYR